MRANYRMQRLFVPADLAQGAPFEVEPAQAHYLLNVLRMSEGSELLVFNGRDGEWLASIATTAKKKATLVPLGQTRAQPRLPDLLYCFAPLKQGRLDYMVQKAVELGVAALVPVMTRHTVADRVNLERMRANVIEAAEQCGVLRVPEIHAPAKLNAVLANWSADRVLFVCDEAAPVADPVAVLRSVPDGPMAVLIGPEGGFSDDERQLLRACPFVRLLSLGPRVMRADTAAVAALALVNAVRGDWR